MVSVVACVIVVVEIVGFEINNEIKIESLLLGIRRGARLTVCESNVVVQRTGYAVVSVGFAEGTPFVGIEGGSFLGAWRSRD